MEMEATSSDIVIQRSLNDKCEKLEDLLQGDVIFIRAPMRFEIDDLVRQEVENLATSGTQRNMLAVVLETNGGFVEVVERISEVFRHHYEKVIFVVPNAAYSAGTVLALSGDAIYMDYYSVLGPIDPQIMSVEGRIVPAIGYLEEYEKLLAKSRDQSICEAEMHILLNKFDPATLFVVQQAKEHSAKLIERWLCEYKFRDWDTTMTDKTKRAREIAEILGNPKRWNSHGRGIPMRILETKEINLRINDFGSNPELKKAIREYYALFIDYCGKYNTRSAVHTKNRFYRLGEAYEN